MQASNHLFWCCVFTRSPTQPWLGPIWSPATRPTAGIRVATQHLSLGVFRMGGFAKVFQQNRDITGIPMGCNIGSGESVCFHIKHHGNHGLGMVAHPWDHRIEVAKAQRGTLSLGVAGSQVWIGSKRWIEMVGLSSSQPVAVLMTQTFLIRTGDVSKPIKSLYFRGNKQPWAMNQIHQRYFRLPSGCHPGAIRVPGF